MDSIPKIERCKTGIDMLDDRILNGGLPRGGITLVSGSSGVGKTTLCSHFLFNGAKKYNENGLLFTLTESVSQLKKYMGQFKFYDEKLVEKGKVQILDMRAIYRQLGMNRDQDTLQDMNAILRIVDSIIGEYNIRRVVVDSVSAMAFRLVDKNKIRDLIFRFGGIIVDRDCTCLLTSEEASGIRRYSEFNIEFICDGIFFLRERELGNTLIRTLQVIKMRGTNHLRNEHELIMDSSGIALTEKTF
jgi:circadian clock protein KaiC